MPRDFARAVGHTAGRVTILPLASGWGAPIQAMLVGGHTLIRVCLGWQDFKT